MFKDLLMPLPNLRPASRISPAQEALKSWQRLLKSKHGPFFNIRFDSKDNLVCVASGVGNQCWAVPLQQVSKGKPIFSLDVASWANACKPIGDLVQSTFPHVCHVVEPAVYVLSIQISAVNGSVVHLTVVEATLLEKLQRTKPTEEGVSDLSEESGIEAAMISSDSESELVFSDCDSEAEKQVEEEVASLYPSSDSENESAPQNEEQPKVERAVAGTHIIGGVGSGYFSLAHYKASQDAKMILRDRWAGKGELGPSGRSKTLRVVDYDLHGGADPPVQTFLALKGWMLWRASRDNWHLRQKSRQTWYLSELTKLKAERQGIALNTATETALRRWVPEVLA